jgi:hypothetical protein
LGWLKSDHKYEHFDSAGCIAHKDCKILVCTLCFVFVSLLMAAKMVDTQSVLTELEVEGEEFD